jgi:hypothetical protein
MRVSDLGRRGSRSVPGAGTISYAVSASIISQRRRTVITLQYGGSIYPLTVQGEHEIRDLVSKGGGWFDLVRGGESLSLWIGPGIPLVIKTVA